MKRIGISQRVDTAPHYKERRDGLDQRWAPLLEALGFWPVIIPNTLQNVSGFIKEMGVEGLIFSGGNDLADYAKNGVGISLERDQTEEQLIMVALEKQMPVLGVCRGLQFIAHYFGASLLEIDGHVGVEHDIRLDSFVGKHHCRVNSFHRLGIDGSHLPSCLKSGSMGF